METCQIAINDQIATVTMTRPQVFNAMDEKMVGELTQIYSDLANDESVRVIVLTGSGRVFSAGADLHAMKRSAKAPFADNKRDALNFSNMLKTIYRTPKPTIALVNGLAFGGGFGLTCAVDIAIANSKAQFCVSEAKFGIIPSMIAPYVLGAIGKRHARHLALTAKRIDALEAYRIGLVHYVGDEPDKILADVVHELLTSSPNAQMEVKHLFDILPAGMLNDEIIDLTASTIARIRATDQAIEGISAFLEKRTPNWIK